LRKVPYLLVVGDREVEQGTISVRDRRGQDLGIFDLEKLAARLGDEVANRTH